MSDDLSTPELQEQLPAAENRPIPPSWPKTETMPVRRAELSRAEQSMGG